MLHVGRQITTACRSDDGFRRWVPPLRILHQCLPEFWDRQTLEPIASCLCCLRRKLLSSALVVCRCHDFPTPGTCWRFSNPLPGPSHTRRKSVTSLSCRKHVRRFCPSLRFPRHREPRQCISRARPSVRGCRGRDRATLAALRSTACCWSSACSRSCASWVSAPLSLEAPACFAVSSRCWLSASALA